MEPRRESKCHNERVSVTGAQNDSFHSSYTEVDIHNFPFNCVFLTSSGEDEKNGKDDGVFVAHHFVPRTVLNGL